MFDSKIEELAKNVRESGGATTVPIDLYALCKAEEIELVPLSSHARFNGKIEFLRDVGTFVIYYPDPATYEWPRRLRFSLAHELGHYHIEEHRQALIKGITHNSISGFKSKDPKEVQADEFAAALLIPWNLMEPKIEKRGFLSLQDVMDVSAKCEASLPATAIRYVRMASESCIAVVASQGKVAWKFHSDEARAKYLSNVTCTDLPPTSPAHRLCIGSHPEVVLEKEHPATDWINCRSGNLKFWEECTSLGAGYTLSLLSISKN